MKNKKTLETIGRYLSEDKIVNEKKQETMDDIEDIKGIDIKEKNGAVIFTIDKLNVAAIKSVVDMADEEGRSIKSEIKNKKIIITVK